MPWVNHKKQPILSRGESTLQFDTKFAFAAEKGLNAEPDDTFREGNTIIGIWVIPKEANYHRWTNPKITRCVNNNSIYEASLHLNVSRRYWRAISKKVKGLEGRPPDDVRLEDDHVVGVWYNVRTNRCPNIRWENVEMRGNVLVGNLSVNGDTDEQKAMARLIPGPDNKLPDVVVGHEGKIYGMWGSTTVNTDSTTINTSSTTAPDVVLAKLLAGGADVAVVTNKGTEVAWWKLNHYRSGTKGWTVGRLVPHIRTSDVPNPPNIYGQPVVVDGYYIWRTSFPNAITIAWTPLGSGLAKLSIPDLPLSVTEVIAKELPLGNELPTNLWRTLNATEENIMGFFPTLVKHE
jgi:hypothetical protein